VVTVSRTAFKSTLNSCPFLFLVLWDGWLKFSTPSAEKSLRQEANGQAHYMRAEFVSIAFGIGLGMIQV